MWGGESVRKNKPEHLTEIKKKKKKTHFVLELKGHGCLPLAALEQGAWLVGGGGHGAAPVRAATLADAQHLAAPLPLRQLHCLSAPFLPALAQHRR